MNISLMCKWWWKLDTETGIWQDIVKAKYLSKCAIGNVQHRLGDSPAWSDLMKIKKIYLRGREIMVRNGKNSLLWTDPWLEGKPLCAQYPIHYELCEDKNITVRDFWDKNGVISFRRWLPDYLHEQ